MAHTFNLSAQEEGKGRCECESPLVCNTLGQLGLYQRAHISNEQEGGREGWVMVYAYSPNTWLARVYRARLLRNLVSKYKDSNNKKEKCYSLVPTTGIPLLGIQREGGSKLGQA